MSLKGDINLGKDLFLKGRYADACEVFEWCTKNEGPGFNPEAHTNLAMSYSKLGMFDEMNEQIDLTIDRLVEGLDNNRFDLLVRNSKLLSRLSKKDRILSKDEIYDFAGELMLFADNIHPDNNPNNDHACCAAWMAALYGYNELLRFPLGKKGSFIDERYEVLQIRTNQMLELSRHYNLIPSRVVLSEYIKLWRQSSASLRIYNYMANAAYNHGMTKYANALWRFYYKILITNHLRETLSCPYDQLERYGISETVRIKDLSSFSYEELIEAGNSWLENTSGIVWQGIRAAVEAALCKYHPSKVADDWGLQKMYSNADPGELKNIIEYYLSLKARCEEAYGHNAAIKYKEISISTAPNAKGLFENQIIFIKQVIRPHLVYGLMKAVENG